MHPSPLESPSFSIALALGAGMIAQAVARHLRIPGIVLLLAAGVALGPDGLNVVRPQALGDTLQAIVGFAVAVILFEGGMNLQVRRLRRSASSIRRLVTAGALVTMAGGAVAAHYLLGWSWTVSLLFGSLVIVTGPTVVTPLLRRIRVTSRVGTVLEAEGVLGDAIGAVVAVVTLEVVIGLHERGAASSFLEGGLDLVSRFGIGAAVGAVGGFLLALLLRRRHVVPEGLENVFTLSLALVIFHAANAMLHESGIVAVTVAGIVVGNMQTEVLDDLLEFKEQLTVLLIGMLFVLLAADTRLTDVKALGMPGLWTVLALMFVVRPLTVTAGTVGTDLTLRERSFVSLMAPRGIVAAAVASLFAQSMANVGIAGGLEVRALVFLVIAITVVFAGIGGGPAAKLLRVARSSPKGFVLVGANPLGRALAHVLRAKGADVVLIDSSHDACRDAENEGLRVLHGSALNERLLTRAEIEAREGAIGLTANDEVNLIFVRTAREEYRVPNAWAGIRRGHTSVSPEMVHEPGARVLFGAAKAIDLWALRLERGLATRASAKVTKVAEDMLSEVKGWPEESDAMFLQLAVVRGGRARPFDDRTRLKDGDVLELVLFEDARARTEAWLRDHGFTLERGTEGGDDGPPEPERARAASKG